MNISIVVPAHNESPNLPSLVETLDNLRKKQKWDCELVIVNDNSFDATQEIAEKLAKKYGKIKVVNRKGNQGMGNSLKEGTQKASGKIIFWTMADNSDDSATFPKMLDKINNGYDLVFGSRFIKGGSPGDITPYKAWLSRTYTIMTKLLFGIKVNDVTNAFRCFRKSIFAPLNIQSSEFAISPEFAIKAHKAGLKLGEVPTLYTNRVAGKPTFKIMRMGVKYTLLFKYIFKK